MKDCPFFGSVKTGPIRYHGNRGWISLPDDHRAFSRTLYMAKPRTANSVAPTLALSQKVELVRSSWIICLLSKEAKINTENEGKKKDIKKNMRTERG